MNTQGLWQLIHLFFAFSYVGSLVVAEWNGRAARASQDWALRANLFHIVYLSSRVAGAGALFLTGVFGHLTAVQAGLRMARDPWMWWVTGLWLLALAGMFLLNVPQAARLAATARQAAAGGSSEGYASALARWRFGNVVQSVLYLSLLALMVFRWNG